MNPFFRRTLLLFFTVLSFSLFSQDAKDSVTDVPGLAGQPHYTEQTVFESNTFYHRISYNRPGTVDDEHTYTLRLQFSDFEKIKPGQVLNLATDTVLVHCSFGILSVWTWNYDAKASFTGTVTVISKTKKEIVIEEDVRIRNREGKTLIYRTRKTFIPAPKR
jgi:hypothetical protein